MDKNGYLSRLVALPETNSKLAPQNGWKLEDAISFQTCPIFRGKLAVSFRECNSETKKNIRFETPHLVLAEVCRGRKGDGSVVGVKLAVDEFAASLLASSQLKNLGPGCLGNCGYF